jgi:hypothetical protein
MRAIAQLKDRPGVNPDTIATLATIHETVIMTAITADSENAFAHNPPFARAHEALSSIMAQHGRARMAAWTRAADDDATRIVAVMLENTKAGRVELTTRTCPIVRFRLLP